MQRYLPGTAATLRHRRASAPYFRVDCASTTRRVAVVFEIVDFNADRNRIDRDRLHRFLFLRYRFLCRRSAEFDSGPKLPVTRFVRDGFAASDQFSAISPPTAGYSFRRFCRLNRY